jgi:hypothetical protein
VMFVVLTLTIVLHRIGLRACSLRLRSVWQLCLLGDHLATHNQQAESDHHETPHERLGDTTLMVSTQ